MYRTSLLLACLCVILTPALAGHRTAKSPIETPEMFRFTLGEGNQTTLVSVLLVTDHGHLILADKKANLIRMRRLENPTQDLCSVNAVGSPDSLLQLRDGHIAVGFREAKKIMLLRVTNNSLEIVKILKTERMYQGLAQGPEDTMFAVSPAFTNKDEKTRIDQLTLRGKLVRTLFEDTHDEFKQAFYTRRYGNYLFFTDHLTHKLTLIDLKTNELCSFFRGRDLNGLGVVEPRSVEFDRHGNMYVAVLKSDACKLCIIQMDGKGNITPLTFIKPSVNTFPYGVFATNTQLVTSWWTWKGSAWQAEVMSHQLPY